MIDDLFTELAVDALDRLLSPETPRDEADFGLARLNSRLSPRLHREEVEPEREWRGDSDPELEVRLLSHYLQLGVDDLQQVSPRVHEWLLDRLAQRRASLSAGDLGTLTALYFLFPESTVRHSVVGLIVQADSRREAANVRQRDTSLEAIWDAIDHDEGLSSEHRIEQLQLLAELVLDYVDLFPGATERGLVALHRTHRDETLTAHLLDWAGRVGGSSGERIQRTIEESDRLR
jgi:hypothetical protein